MDAERLTNVEEFSEDLQVILAMLRYRNSREELTDYINQNKEFFQHVDYETSQAMKAFLNMKDVPGKVGQNNDVIDTGVNSNEIFQCEIFFIFFLTFRTP